MPKDDYDPFGPLDRFMRGALSVISALEGTSQRGRVRTGDAVARRNMERHLEKRDEQRQLHKLAQRHRKQYVYAFRLEEDFEDEYHGEVPADSVKEAKDLLEAEGHTRSSLRVRRIYPKG